MNRRNPSCVEIVLSSMLLSLFATSLSAEMVFLRSGPPVDGRIVRQSKDSIEITTGKGNRTIAKRDIARIQYVSVTNEQKRLLGEKQRKLEEARRVEKVKIEQQKLAKAEMERRLKELEDQILAEKKKEAQERADRAAALRELVKNGQMEKPADEPISYMDFAWRSLLVPGWGHFTLDKPVVGSLYLGTAVILGANFLQQRRIAVPAAEENHKQVLLNALIVLDPNLVADQNTRLALNYYSNSNYMTTYKKKIDNYNRSLYLLEAFYIAQAVHIIYNGIAWENGLLIVDRGPEGQSLGAAFSAGPDATTDGRLAGRSMQLGLVYSF